MKELLTEGSLKITNTLSHKKEDFQPSNPPFVGMYVCGPTVYGDAHLGHARTYVSFDVIYRWLLAKGYKVRYVRNITDVGHLTGDTDEGDDKIGKQARLEQKDPMEVAQLYSNRFHEDMNALNILPPSIEPLATGHIVEQIELVQRIMEKGLAYEVNGSVYFDVNKYHESAHYGKLSGRNIEELLATTRENLVQQDEKRNPADFALWKKAATEHLMKWKSPWGDGFPGWHLECSAMGKKYLGEQFDIHGGGLDLTFPHHECEIAQSNAGWGNDPCRYWLHTNMITVNGQKMGKSLGNAISLRQLFSGTHPLLEKGYSAMTVRYFILQAHYRGTLDFSNEALSGAGVAYRKLMNTVANAEKLLQQENEIGGGEEDTSLLDEMKKMVAGVSQGMNDDFNTAKCLAQLTAMAKRINTFMQQKEQLQKIKRENLQHFIETFVFVVEEVLGLKNEPQADVEELIELILPLYLKAKNNKDYSQVDAIRAALSEKKIRIKDTKQGVDWEWE